jgi:ABC-2 type transport system ATP-binding protein
MAIIDKGTIVKYGPIRSLLASMEDEVISVDLDKSYSGDSLKAYIPIVGEMTLDLTVSSKHTLDTALNMLQKDGYKIKSIKPKSGRLEEFFLKSTGK